MSPLPLWLLACAIAGATAVVGAEALVRLPRFQAVNYLGKTIPTAYGTGGAGAQVLAVLMFAAVGMRVARPVALVSLGLAALCLLGLVDDLFGRGGPFGLRGHVRALFKERRVTTGVLKLLLGGGACLAVGLALRPGSPWQGVADGLLLASFANLLNLLDRRPGRVQKVFVVGLAAAVLLKGWRGLAPMLPFAAAMLAFLPEDMAGLKMMGDAGSNATGFALAFLLLDAPLYGRLTALALALALNLASERYSFTHIIERNRVLRFLDRTPGTQ